jgi:hypothetical protein
VSGSPGYKTTCLASLRLTIGCEMASSRDGHARMSVGFFNTSSPLHRA